MEFSLKSVYNLDDELETVLTATLKVKKLEDLTSTVLNRTNKDAVIKLVQSLGKLLERSNSLLKVAAADLDSVKSSQLKNQALLISTQEELIKSKTVQVEAIKSTVSTEMKSWSEVVSEKLENSERSVSSDSITTKNIKEAVKSVDLENEKLKNLMVYNVQEESEEDDFALKDDLDDDDEQDDERTVQRILMKTAGINITNPDYERVGKKDSDKKRPIIVRLGNARQVSVILANSRKLKDDGELKSAFIGPDRTREQREDHRNLVIQLRQKRKEDSDKYFFIRNGLICSADKK